MKTRLIGARILVQEPTPRFEARDILMDEEGIILAVTEPGQLPAGERTLDVSGTLIAPGLVDVHTHGRAGGDFISADIEQLQVMSASYLDAGVTTVMPTLASAPYEDFGTAADRIAAVAAKTAAPHAEGARFVGLHLEGRYLNPEKRGAHAPALLVRPDAQELDALHERMRRPYASAQPALPCPMRLSAALELDTDGNFCRTARALGISLSLGHTAAPYATARDLIAEQGVVGLTHLYNAMPPLHHRAGGAVMACFDAARAGQNVFGELICDGLHIAPEMVRLAWAMLGEEHTVLISDSMEGTGCPDGDYSIAGEHVTLKDGKALTDSGALAGSTLNLLDGVNNLIRFCGISAAAALRCATLNPARLAGLDGVGVIAPGTPADLLILQQEPDGTLTQKAVLVGGVCRRGTLSC